MMLVVVWLALSVVIVLLGRLIENEKVLGVGAIMMLMTCMVDF